jgi:hypothetical protein
MAGLGWTQMCRGASSAESCKALGVQKARECLIERKIQSYRIAPVRRLDGHGPHDTAYAQPFILGFAADGLGHRQQHFDDRATLKRIVRNKTNPLEGQTLRKGSTCR